MKMRWGRKFIIVLVYIGIRLANDAMSLDLSDETMKDILYAALGFVGIEGLVDASAAIGKGMKGDSPAPPPAGDASGGN